MKPYIFNEYNGPIVLSSDILLMRQKDLLHITIYDYKRNTVLKLIELENKIITKLYFINDNVLYGEKLNKNKHLFINTIFQNINCNDKKIIFENIEPISAKKDVFLGSRIIFYTIR